MRYLMAEDWAVEGWVRYIRERDSEFSELATREERDEFYLNYHFPTWLIDKIEEAL